MWQAKDRGDADSLIDFYNQCDAYIYELLWWHALQKGESPAWCARLLELAWEHGSRRYLDFGGGIGTNAILLGREGIEVTVADVSDGMQSFARWRLERRGIEARFIDLKSAPLEEERYDLVSAIDVLEHVQDPIDTLRTLHRALAPGGLLVFDLIASKADPKRPFHLMRSKYRVRAHTRSLGLELLDGFQKFLVYRKRDRGTLARRTISAWDVCRWRLYYLLQGRWPP